MAAEQGCTLQEGRSAVNNDRTNREQRKKGVGVGEESMKEQKLEEIIRNSMIV